MRAQRFIFEFFKWCFTVIWLYAGTIKSIDHKLFIDQLEMSPLLAPVSVFISFTFPLLEFIAAILLINPRTLRHGLFLTFYLYLSLALYILYLFFLAPKVPCACGGIIERLNWSGHLILNFSCAALTAILIRINPYRKTGIVFIESKNFSPSAL